MTGYSNPFSDKEHFPEHAEWISEHIDKFFDQKLVTVFHEIVILDIHLELQRR